MDLQPCPACGAPLTDADKHAGPDAPEVGWEYYVCPACSAHHRPNVIEPEAATPPQEPDKFTGVVVKVSNPVVIDDGDTVVECHGIEAHSVKLGAKITVQGTMRDDPTTSDPDEARMLGCELISD